MWCCMIETSSVLSRNSSFIFGNPRKLSGNVRLAAFGTILENLRKSSESGRKSLENRQTSSLACLYNKQNITCPLVDTDFIFSCLIRYHSSAALTPRETSSWTREDKIHIHARACNILYLFPKHSIIVPIYTLSAWYGIRNFLQATFDMTTVKDKEFSIRVL